MMKKIYYFGMCIVFALFSSMGYSDDERSVFSYSYYVSTDNTDAVIKQVRAFVPAKKGYVGYFSNDRIYVRLPLAEVESLRRMLADLGYVIGENHKREDLTLKLLDLETRLATKQKLLFDLKEISSLRLSETLQVEQEMNRVIIEIEDIKGKLAFYRDRIAHCEVTVFFNRAYSPSKTSTQNVPAEWFHRLGIENLMRER